MTISNRKERIPCDIHQVWTVVTDVENYVTWRSDLSKIEIIDDRQFVEYNKKGYPTTFTVTVTKPCQRWEFDMENSNMKGHWTGVFTAEENATTIVFTEVVKVKKWYSKPFIKAYLQRQQARFSADLRKALM